MSETVAVLERPETQAPAESETLKRRQTEFPRTGHFIPRCDVQIWNSKVIGVDEINGELRGPLVVESIRATRARSAEWVADVRKQFEAAFAGLPETVEVHRLETAVGGYKAKLTEVTGKATALKAKITAAAESGDLSSADRKQLQLLADERGAYADVLGLAENNLRAARAALQTARKAAIVRVRAEVAAGLTAEHKAILNRIGDALAPLLAELHANRDNSRALQSILLGFEV